MVDVLALGMDGNAGHTEVHLVRLNTVLVQTTFTFTQWINTLVEVCHLSFFQLKKHPLKVCFFKKNKVMLKSSVWQMEDGTTRTKVENGPITKLVVE